VPSGSVVFTLDGAAQPAISLAGGQAHILTTSLAVGSHSASVGYSGDGSFTGSSAGPITFSVARASTTLALSSTPNANAVFNQPVSFLALVSATPPGGGTPAGSVVFTVDGTAQAPVNLTIGGAALNISSLAVGSHTVSAAYGGSGSFNAGSGGPLTLTVTKADVTLAITYSPQPAVGGHSLTLTITVTPAPPAVDGKPDGTVTIYDGSALLGTAPVDPGTAVYTISSVGSGNHAFSATFSGTASFNTASSGVLAVAVAPELAYSAAGLPWPLAVPLAVLGLFLLAWSARRRRPEGAR
jgi:hypothetical protein